MGARAVEFFLRPAKLLHQTEEGGLIDTDLNGGQVTFGHFMPLSEFCYCRYLWRRPVGPLRLLLEEISPY